MKIRLPVWKITLLISIFIAVFGNITFWGSIFTRVSFTKEPLIAIGLFIILVALINLLLTFVSFKPVFKIIASFVLIASASAAYFMDNYAVMIDKEMIRNVFATDFQEANELLSFKLIITMLFIAGVPIFLLFKTEIIYKPFFQGLLHKILVSTISVTILISTLYVNYQQLSFFARENRIVRHYINPANYISSIKSLAIQHFSEGQIVVKSIENDAKKIKPTSHNNKPALTILVLGETARSMNFSLNGYSRDTNPLMAQEDIVNFNDVTSCGTATAVSVPCMFSKFNRTDYSHSKGKRNENLLDVVVNANYDVQWLDNNTGCQGVCNRIHYESLANAKNPKYCGKGNCFDEILLDGLQARIDKQLDANKKDKLIVLHLNGNHGPTYHMRYPKDFKKFTPVCETNQLINCTQEEVVNAYDNAIFYTDYLLAKTLEVLKSNSANYNTSMLYISDHGESLGENNLYLHGLPYIVAPDYQKKVPMMLWLSEGYQQSYGLNQSCISQKSGGQYSHDNFFSSMLGLLSIETKVYKPELDIFSSCQQTNLVKNEG